MTVPKPSFSKIPRRTLVSTYPVSEGSYTRNASATGSKFLISLVRDIEGKSDDITDPRDQFEHVLRHHFEAATDDSLPSNKRRTSWSLVQSLLSKFDTQLAARQVQENTRHNNTSRDNLSSGIPAAGVDGRTKVCCGTTWAYPSPNGAFRN